MAFDYLHDLIRRISFMRIQRSRRRSAAPVLCAAILILAAAITGLASCQNQRDNTDQTTSLSVSGSPSPDASSSSSSSDASQSEDPKEDTLSSDWRLLLVNRDHPLTDYQPELKLVSNNSEVDVRIYDDLVALLEAGRADGISLFPCSGYRSYDLQVELYNDKVDRLMEQGLSREEAETQAATEVAQPGTSEHITGLCADIVGIEYQLLDDGFADTDAARWLAEHAWEYGFILRFPEGKEDITGVIYEPWHYRYVGKEAAKEIHEKGITLEEYLGAV